MDTQATAEKVRDVMFADDAASRMLGLQITEVSPGRAVATMTVRPDMLNGFGICHGGLIATLADSAFAFACNSRNAMTVASGFAIDILKSAKLGDVLTATAAEASLAGRTGLYDITVRNQEGELIALFRGRSYRLGERKVFDEGMPA
ncbi:MULTISPECIES: hydroxyphenylacetyl-CoA thioesterase PaaI [Roseateles]|uniref:Hydroxyphenylacetyl-CoA thioesterase PaaI n=1 Tax=Pelomonas caseinilytica TaxID=2906763 RepID=A0ABS8XCB3_9BURK|nr:MULTISPECIES: hydroxyphenylacetyl-CoA thioesterase PaaI [unclassified Roseateles]MCE4536860.1 hydroxyphenylacetyl-CoA thioesterase PaaI [Pelomonas sp. P7]HEV6967514.1 hydroxyphenylacetyl-CoA thioesterase PaaI [Roseateles sp.]